MKAKNRKRKAEVILYGWNEGRHYFTESREEADVWDIKRVGNQSMVHPTQKPVALITKAIQNSSKHGQVVLDLFGGSGATLVACEKSGRKSYTNELDPKYCDIIIKRWEALTRDKAIKI